MTSPDLHQLILCLGEGALSLWGTTVRSGGHIVASSTVPCSVAASSHCMTWLRDRHYDWERYGKHRRSDKKNIIACNVTAGIQWTKCWGTSEVKRHSRVCSLFRFWWTIRAGLSISQKISQWQPVMSSPLWLLEKKWVSVLQQFSLNLWVMEMDWKICFSSPVVVVNSVWLPVSFRSLHYIIPFIGCIKIPMSVFYSTIKVLWSCSSCTVVWMRLLLCGAPLGFLLLTPSHCSESVNIY